MDRDDPSEGEDAAREPLTGKNPFGHPITADWKEDDLWAVVSEGRPERMHWLYMVPLTTGDFGL